LVIGLMKSLKLRSLGPITPSIFGEDHQHSLHEQELQEAHPDWHEPLLPQAQELPGP
jgi:hypothetical protein